MDYKYSIIDDQVEITEYIGFNLEEIIVPTTIEGCDVISVAESAFRGLNVSKVVFPERLKFIGNRAFFECTMLEEVILPYSMEICEEYAFYNCSSLKYVDMGGTKHILGHCFEQCKRLETVKLPNELMVLGESCFANCISLQDINIPTHIMGLRSKTFAGCQSLKKIVIPRRASYIENNCFMNCIGLNQIEIEGIEVSFGSDVFTCYEWKRPTKMDGTEDERYKLKSKRLDMANKTLFCLAGSSAQKYAQETKIICKPLINEEKDELEEEFYEIYLHFRVTAFKDVPLLGIQHRGMDSVTEQKMLEKEMDSIVSEILSMSKIEKKYKTNYCGRSGRIIWHGNKKDTFELLDKLSQKLNVTAYGNKGEISIETNTIYDY